MPRRPVVGMCAMLALASLAQSAELIYRWVDASGVVHFGDEPPANGTTDVRTMELEITPAAEEAAEEYSINNQLERLYRTRPTPPQKPVTSPPTQETPYSAPPSVIYRPLYGPYGPYYGYPPKHRPGHSPASPGGHPHPSHPVEPAPHPPELPSGRLWLPR